MFEDGIWVLFIQQSLYRPTLPDHLILVFAIKRVPCGGMISVEFLQFLQHCQPSAPTVVTMMMYPTTSVYYYYYLLTVLLPNWILSFSIRIFSGSRVCIQNKNIFVKSPDTRAIFHVALL